MGGWCPSSSVCGMAVVCAAAVLPVQWCGSCPTRPIAVLASTAVMSCTVLCQMWCVGGECVSVLFVWWGILCVLPLTVVVGGAVVDGGWHGGWWVAW